jgi:hypothetical protein
MRAFNAGWRGLAGAGLLAVAMTGCSASPASGPGAAEHPSSRPASTAPGTASSGQSPSSTPGVSTSPTESTAIQNLLVSSAVRSQLTAAFEALKKISASDVSGTVPNSVYYAYDQATNNYWALARFLPSRTAPLDVVVDFQDGGDMGLFTKIGSGPWQVQVGGEPAVCAEKRFFPKAVLAVWAISTSSPPGVNC